MHTFEGRTCRIHHNGDYSGAVIIAKAKEPSGEVEVDVADLVTFIANMVAYLRVCKIEDSQPEEILGIPTEATLSSKTLEFFEPHRITKRRKKKSQ